MGPISDASLGETQPTAASRPIGFGWLKFAMSREDYALTRRHAARRSAHSEEPDRESEQFGEQHGEQPLSGGWYVARTSLVTPKRKAES
jgi:hypothetical protein